MPIMQIWSPGSLQFKMRLILNRLRLASEAAKGLSEDLRNGQLSVEVAGSQKAAELAGVIEELQNDMDALNFELAKLSGQIK